MFGNDSKEVGKKSSRANKLSKDFIFATLGDDDSRGITAKPVNLGSTIFLRFYFNDNLLKVKVNDNFDKDNGYTFDHGTLSDLGLPFSAEKLASHLWQIKFSVYYVGYADVETFYTFTINLDELFIEVNERSESRSGPHVD